MTPSARVQTAIEFIDAIIRSARDNGAAADNLIAQGFRERRYMGSKDRRAVRDLVYRVIRAFGDPPLSGRAAMIALAETDADLAALFDGSHYGPAAIDADEPRASGGAVPGWLEDRFAEPVDAAERQALLGRAPLDIRFRPDRIDGGAIRRLWPAARFHDALPAAARLEAGTRIEESPLWEQGALEVQDWGSQAIVAACGGMPNARLVIDLCAGAGGKTLALAAQAPETCRIIASDVSRARLDQLEPRRIRAGHGNIETLLLDPGREWERLGALAEKADLVLVDAPCSGAGTWRRNPETRWRLTPERLDRLVDQQRRLIELASRLVRPGGQMVYAVCSLLAAEGPGQIGGWVAGHPDWKVDVPAIGMGRPVWFNHGSPAGIIVTPQHDGTDGFFFTRMLKSC